MDTTQLAAAGTIIAALAGAVAKLYTDNRSLNKQLQDVLKQELKNSRETEKRGSSLLKTITDQQKVVYERTIPNNTNKRSKK